MNVTVGMSLSIGSIFFLIFLLLYPWKLKMVSLSSFHYCMLSYKTHKAKQSSLHKEDPISHMCELKLRILLCSVFLSSFKMLY